MGAVTVAVRRQPEFWIPADQMDVPSFGAYAAMLEADGWDGLTVGDTQCMRPDPFVTMTVAALATTTLRFSIATSNPVTRHPSVAATAIASVAELAPGRVTFGVGRGDSALAHVGGAPASVETFEHFLSVVRSYLSGDRLPFHAIREWLPTADVSTLELGHAPADSWLGWRGQAPVRIPIEVYGTGPRVLAAGARQADKVTFGVGADPRRVTWAVRVLNEARRAAGSRGDLLLGAIVCMGPFEDMERARRSVGNALATSARFAVMGGPVAGPLREGEGDVYRSIVRRYDMDRHGGFGDQVAALTDEFVDRNAIVGSPDRCVARLLELHELGVDSFHVAPPLGDASEEDRREGYRRIADEVIPGFRAALR
jgi:5,10-methylenetetrahydromethanopterin reductase